MRKNTMDSLPDFQPPAADIAAAARGYLKTLRDAEKAALHPQFPVDEWLARRTRQTDAILQALHAAHFPDNAVSLFALGGYGRGELFPRSDIDLLILRPAAPPAALERRIEAFVQDLWRLGLDIAQQVADSGGIIGQARTDTDTLTSLLEARRIAGDGELPSVSRPPLIPPLDFIRAKLHEQHHRDSRQEQMGRLEPSIKIAPGSLRDTHMIAWVERYCASDSALTAAEAAELAENRDTIRRIRYALHLLGGSDKDRLHFERQKRLAALFGWQDGTGGSATEQFMRHYYRTTRRIRRLSRLIVKLLETRYLPPATITELDDTYCIRARRIDFTHPQSADHFRRHPEHLWPIFRHLQNHPELDGLHPILARHLYESRDTLVTHTFRTDTQNRLNFLAILNHPGDVYRQLRRMLRYGILYRYIPGFWHIVGRMQYNLFHQYTVDQHTLRVIAILDSFKQEAPAHPHATRIMAGLGNRAILYLAALFHDIGKGYQSDHSVIGAAMAESFALENDALGTADSLRLIFLVRHHLLMSDTAQKQDLSDPAVITAFAQTVGNQANLDHLYLLTLADISATNDTLWNSWRAALLSTLYQLAGAELAQADTALPAHIDARKTAARVLLTDIADPDQYWQNLPDAFFLGESPINIALKTRDLATTDGQHRAIALPGSPPQLYIRSTHSPDTVFALTTHYLERHNQNIMEARLYQSTDKRLTLQQYTLADSPQTLTELTAELTAHIARNAPLPPVKKRLPAARLQHFPIKTRIRIRKAGAGRSTLELTCQDRHGLLSTVSRIFLAHGIHVEHAKITTLGEKAEDIFYLRHPADSETLQTVKDAIYQALADSAT